MPRIIEPTMGKVVGPLRMKVASATTTNSNGTKRSNSNNQSDTSFHQQERRGRYSRQRNDMKKLRSKSLPPSTESSMLFGKPLEIDEPFCKSYTENISENIKTNVSKKRDLHITTSKKGIHQPRNVDDSKCLNKDDSDHSKQCLSSPTQRHALAMDTRYIPPTDIDEMKLLGHPTPLIRHYKDFLQTLETRGTPPCILTTTVTASNDKPLTVHGINKSNKLKASISALGIGIKSYKLCSDDNRDIFLKVADPLDSTIISEAYVPKSVGGMSFPVSLNASSSWLIFSALVDSIMYEDGKGSGFVSSHNMHKNRAPIDITIMCSDVSLFSDTNLDSHKIALEAFIKHVSLYFDQALLKSIRIVTAKTFGKILIRHERIADDSIVEMKTGNMNYEIPNGVSQENHLEQAIKKCVRMIEWTMDDLENKCNALLKVDAHLEGDSTFSFSMIDNTTMGFMELSRELIRESLRGRQIRLSCRLKNIDLPPSTDGTQCSMSLEASCQVFPFSVNSLHAKMLSMDMDRLAAMDLQVMKLIPLSCIDASLLFGIPMVVRTGLETDYVQFQEMKILVRCLFHVLQVQQQAILLRGSPSMKAHENTTAFDDYNGDGLFHSEATNSPSHFFVLMAQEIPSTFLVGGVAPNSGLLFRMAHADQLITEMPNSNMDSGHTGSSYSPDTAECEPEMAMQYMQYIENSLSELDISSFNPIFDFASTAEQIISPMSQGEDLAEKGNDENIEPQGHGSSTLASKPSSLHPIFIPLSENDAAASPNQMMLSIYDLNTNDGFDYDENSNAIN